MFRKNLATGVFWYWNGEVTPAGIRRQLKSMADAGVSCVYVHPMPDKYHKNIYFAGMKTAYLGKRYFELYHLVLAECKKLGLHLMLYDEGGWPSGSVLDTLIKKYPECEGQFLVRNGKGEVSAVPAGFPDQLIPESTEHFIEMTHELYKREFGSEFGRTIRGIFTDEPFYRCMCDEDMVFFSPEMRSEARKIFNCDFDRDILPLLWKGTEDQPGAFAARRKYFTISSKLFAKNYSAVLSRWCEKNNLDLEGHFDHEDFFFRCGDCGDLMEFCAPMQVPGVDAIWRQIYPGSDNGYFAKFASSAAIRMHRKQALCECFNVYGYGLTPPQMSHVVNQLLIRGINRVIFMPYLYTDHGKHKICCSTDFSPRIPQWVPMKKLISFWNHAAQFDAGAMEAPVWVLARAEYTFPDDRWNPQEKLQQAEKRMLDLLSSLDDNGIFWRFTNLTELNDPSQLPDALVFCGQLEEWEEKIAAGFRERGVKIFNGWNDELLTCAAVEITDDPGKCRILPCLRPEGEALMVFNPTEKIQPFAFKSAVPYCDLTEPGGITPYPVVYENEKVSLRLAPGELRILLKNHQSMKNTPLKQQKISLDWQLKGVEKMEMHALKSTVFSRKKIDQAFPADGIWRDKDFSGVLILESVLNVDADTDGFLEFDALYHAGELSVNGKDSQLCSCAPWVFPVKLSAGANRLQLRVYTSGGNEWRRCHREEMLPRQWSNAHAGRVQRFVMDDDLAGVSPGCRLLTY